ncbi:MAG: HD domain-containing protein, partial [Anaerolineales bacterium]|nr:HD domain-containing protein [Anaerolineales bacterium]
HVPDLTQEETKLTQSPAFAAEQFITYFGVPLLAKGKLVGVLEIFHRSSLDPGRQWVELVEMVAGLAAIAIDHQNLQKELERSRNEITKGFDAIIEGWAQALELRGIEPPGHANRAVDLTLRLADKLGLSGDTLVELRRGALLHDIGKMGIPDQVLHKGKELTKEERKMIGRHPIEAYDLLGKIDALQSARDIPLYHHERWDGTGYPHGLKGDKIPFQARIFAIVDVWDALLTDRPYRDAWPRAKAVAHLKEQAGKHFDPRVVDAFLEIIESDRELEQKHKK